MAEYNRKGIISKSAYNRIGEDVYERHNVEVVLDSAGDTAYNTFVSNLQSIPNYENCLLVGFITDTHKSTNTYWGEQITEEPSFNLLSKICTNHPIKAILHGGDFCNGREADGETKETKLANIQSTITEMNHYFADVPIIPTYGNHDKRYDVESELIRNEELNAIFKSLVSCSDKVRVEYIDQTNFVVDFLEDKLRLIVYNCYDGMDAKYDEDPTQSSSYGPNAVNTAAWVQSLNLPDEYDASEWVIGCVSHYFLYSGIFSFLNAYKNNGNYRNFVNKNGKNGKGYIGTLNGHAHLYKVETHYGEQQVLTTNGYSSSRQMGSADAYAFSIFAFDTESMRFYQIKVGREAEVLSFDIIHDE